MKILNNIKKKLCLLLCIILSFSFCACELSEEDIDDIVSIVSILTEEGGEVTDNQTSTESSIYIEEADVADESDPESAVDESTQDGAEVSEITGDNGEATESFLDGVELLEFRNKKLLDQHFEKHGIEMGFDTAEDYTLAANKVIFNPDSLHKIEKEDGDDVYYLEETNEFVVVSTDGYIRTYFCPDSGKKYFDKQ